MADQLKLNARKGAALLPMQQQDVAVQQTALAVIRDMTGHLDQAVLRNLHDAALGRCQQNCRAVVENAISNGIGPADMADFYIPAVARDMGDRWCSDQMGFADVTIGVARLQAMLHTLGQHWPSDGVAQAIAPSILLVVPQDAYHTLGAIVLGCQLRRRGLSVTLVLGETPDNIAHQLSLVDYGAVFISAAQGVSLEQLRLITQTLRRSVDYPPPVVIGGTLLEIETAESVKTLTGADHATHDIDIALRLCDLDIDAYARYGT